MRCRLGLATFAARAIFSGQPLRMALLFAITVVMVAFLDLSGRLPALHRVGHLIVPSRGVPPQYDRPWW
jgi:hypothetical protein